MMATSSRGLFIAVRLVLAGLAVGLPSAVGVALLYPRVVEPSPEPSLALLAFALGFVAAISGVAFVVGLALYVFLPTRSYGDAVRTYASYLTLVGTLLLALVVGLVFTVGLAAVTGAPMEGGNGIPPQLVVIGVVGIQIPLLLITYFRIVRPGVIPWQEMGLTPDHLTRHLTLGVGTGVGILVLAGILGQILRQFGVESNQQELFEGVRAAGLSEFLAILLAGGILAPVVEEIYFRGYLFTALLRERSAWQAYVFSSILFGLVHINVVPGGLGATLAATLPFIVVGFVLAYVYHQTRSLMPAILAHTVNNVAGLAVLYFGPEMILR